ncbi:MAG: hypothetical protein F6K25_20540 [Okeania sp. SIO2G4]|uniref:hypothetical protein n=1 Tax=unclassified Okeania TaxID=2634635 RepID=UPI0013B60D68|nr:MULTISPECIES: hypothetical protein [unclassified Okeania]NEP04857.1 hypothetical protein [Okeania sp. SIO4D6]NEP42720.1 hypothetical protein [Okeania sp. SIO2H7]NEP74229.1 hypothetical protein [Okeania sp. SIO2G5]NEP95106.1 hypothetical protein [Okeania sp. SIO2F5]NEQ92921.1 hypothetical protein [Okeania sp. SIO2G4]
MQFTPLQPIDNTEPFVSGDVKIEPNVAIASGVILQAAADCQIVIATGVCIGMGVILHAYQGNIEVESGVTIGAGVLVVGKSKIGANACIGSVATIIEHDVEPNQVVQPTSIIGESGRQILENSTTAPSQPPSQTVLTPHITTTTKSNDDLSVDPELSSSSELSEENLSQTSTFNYPDNHQELGSSSELDEENIAQTSTFNYPDNHQELGSSSELSEENIAQKSTFNYPDNHQELGSSSELDEENIAQKSTFKYPGNHQGLNSNYQFFKKTEPENDNSNALVNQELTNNSSSPDQEKAKNEEETQNKIEQAKTQLQEEAPETTKTPIYGQDYVNRMMKTLFPHKNSLSSHPDEED